MFRVFIPYSITSFNNIIYPDFEYFMSAVFNQWQYETHTMDSNLSDFIMLLDIKLSGCKQSYRAYEMSGLCTDRALY